MEELEKRRASGVEALNTETEAFSPTDYLLACLTLDLERLANLPYSETSTEHESRLVRYYSLLSAREAEALSLQLNLFSRQQASWLDFGIQRRLTDPGPDFGPLLTFLCRRRKIVLASRRERTRQWEQQVRALPLVSPRGAEEDGWTRRLTLETGAAAEVMLLIKERSPDEERSPGEERKPAEERSPDGGNGGLRRIGRPGWTNICLSLEKTGDEAYCLDLWQFRSGATTADLPLDLASLARSGAEEKADAAGTPYAEARANTQVPVLPSTLIELNHLSVQARSFSLCVRAYDYADTCLYPLLEFQPWYAVCDALNALRQRETCRGRYGFHDAGERAALQPSPLEERLLRLAPFFADDEEKARSPFSLWTQQHVSDPLYCAALEELKLLCGDERPLRRAIERVLHAVNANALAAAVRHLQGILLSDAGRNPYLKLQKLINEAAARYEHPASRYGTRGLESARQLERALEFCLRENGWAGSYPCYYRRVEDHTIGSDRRRPAAKRRDPSVWALLRLRMYYREDGVTLQFACASSRNTPSAPNAADFDSLTYRAWRDGTPYLAEFEAKPDSLRELALSETVTPKQLFSAFGDLDEKLPALLNLFMGRQLSLAERETLKRHMIFRRSLRLAQIIALALALGVIFFLLLWIVPPLLTLVGRLMRGKPQSLVDFIDALTNKSDLIRNGMNGLAFSAASTALLYFADKRRR